MINFKKKKKKKKKKSDDDDVGFESDKHRYVEFYSTIKKFTESLQVDIMFHSDT
jgi:hypothetical protein